MSNMTKSFHLKLHSAMNVDSLSSQSNRTSAVESEVKHQPITIISLTIAS